ncbi:MAG: flippase-like domain-containing protein [Deltaproteobacteria bacterium]|nr:flippase-like domain-containing protein [Deltaproteobacteria bacterium]
MQQSPAETPGEQPGALVESSDERRGVWRRWLGGLAIGALFTWWSSRSWPLDRLFSGSLDLGRDAHGDWAVRLLGKSGSENWSLDLQFLALYFVFLTVIHWLRVLRWHPLLEPYARVPIAALNRSGAVGFMAVFLLPLRLGELSRPLMLARKHAGHPPVPFAAGLATIALERVLDGLTVTALLFVVLFEVHPATLARHPGIQQAAWIAGAVFSSAILGLGAVLVAREFTLRWTRKILGAIAPGVTDKLLGMVTAFVDGLAVLKSPWHVVQFIGITIVYWGVNGLGIWLMARGFGLEVPVIAGYAMMCFVVVGMMIPNAPANAGSFWYFLLLPAALYGVDEQSPRAVAFGLGLWFVQTVQVTLFGLWGSWADARALTRHAAARRIEKTH